MVSKKNKKPLILLRGHHLWTLYNYVYRSFRKEISEPNKHKFTVKNMEKMLSLFETIKNGGCNVKITEEIDSFCGLCKFKQLPECSKIIHNPASVAIGDRAFIFLLKFRKNQIYTSEFLLKRLEMEFPKLEELLLKLNKGPK